MTSHGKLYASGSFDVEYNIQHSGLAVYNIDFNPFPTTGIAELPVHQDVFSLKMSPNPASDHISFESPESGTLRILANNGQQITTMTVLKGLNTFSIEKLPAGSYRAVLVAGLVKSSGVFIKN
jgi:hypothetical protein